MNNPSPRPRWRRRLLDLLPPDRGTAAAGLVYPDNSWLPHCHCRGILNGMKATIDAAGRIVVPKPLRQALGLKPGQLLEMRAGDGRLEIEIVPTSITLKKRGKGMVAVPDTKLPPLTADQVRETLERVRR